MPATSVKAARKHTRFAWCDKHSHLGNNTRYRQAEFACEGGPGWGSPGCRGGVCQVFAGTDFFTATVCFGEFLSQHATWAVPEESVRYTRDTTGGWEPATVTLPALAKLAGKPGSNAYCWTTEYDQSTDEWTATTPEGQRVRYTRVR